MTSTQASSTRGLPAWLLYVLLAGAVGAGGYYVWWSMQRVAPGMQADAIELDPRAAPSSGPPAPPPLPQGQDRGATMVTLDLKGVSPAEAFAALAKQSGYEIRPAGPDVWRQARGKSVTAALASRPFWPAFFELCRQADVYPQENSYDGDRGGASRQCIFLIPDSTGRARCPAVASGSFLIVLRRIQHTAGVNLSVDPTPRHGLQLDLALYVEPKVSALEVGYAPDVEQAVDDAGNSLMPRRGGGRGYSPMQSPWTSPLQIHLAYPARPGKRIARLAGTVRVVAGTMQTIEVNNLLKVGDVGKTADGMSVGFTALRKTGGGYAVEIALSGGDRLAQVARLLIRSGQARLFDAQGREYVPNSTDSSRDRGGYTGTFRFARGRAENGEPARLVLTVPTQLREIPVPFKFADLPLP